MIADIFAICGAVKMVLDKRVGFIGAGQMAEALARGFVDKGVVKAESLRVTDPSKARRDLFQEMGAQAHEKASEVSFLPICINSITNKFETNGEKSSSSNK